MAIHSAGLLLYERHPQWQWRVLLVHPGGPFFANRDEGSWGIPKGQLEPGEPPLLAACREFTEETGHVPPDPGAEAMRVNSDTRCGIYLPLGSVSHPGRKTIHAWAFPGQWVPERFRSQVFSLEWPPRSGKMVTVPEVDRACLFTLEEAVVKLLPMQVPFIERLRQHLLRQDG